LKGEANPARREMLSNMVKQSWIPGHYPTTFGHLASRVILANWRERQRVRKKGTHSPEAHFLEMEPKRR